jgi:hypothetical protein
MTDITPSNATIPASLAVRVLCQQLAQRVQAEAVELAKIAFASDNIDPQAYQFNWQTGEFVPVAPTAE